MLVCSVWNKILKIWDTVFELTQIEVQCSKNYFKIFLPLEARTFGNNRKEPTQATPNIEKIYILYIYTEYLICLQSNASGSFFAKMY